MVFGLVQHHKWTVSDVENLLPYERDLYFTMLMEHIEKQKEASLKN